MANDKIVTKLSPLHKEDLPEVFTAILEKIDAQTAVQSDEEKKVRLQKIA
jgi:hypothetical protein